MKNQQLKRSILGLFIFSLPVLGSAQVPEPQTDGNIQFISGGIGSDESASIKAVAKKWPLYIEFSKRDENKSVWISEVSVTITDAKGQQVFTQSNQGPMLLVGLKPGKYSIQASYEDVKMVRSLTVSSSQFQKISFQWK
jgi:hypothetical protein